MSEDYGSVLSRYNYQIEEDKNQALMLSLKSDRTNNEKDAEAEIALPLGAQMLEKATGYLKDKALEGAKALKDNITKTWEDFGSSAEKSVAKIFTGNKSATDTAIDNMGDADKGGYLRNSFNQLKTEYASAASDLEKAKALPDTGADVRIAKALRGSQINTTESKLADINVRANALADEVTTTTNYLKTNAAADLRGDINAVDLRGNINADNILADINNSRVVDPTFNTTIQNPMFEGDRDPVYRSGDNPAANFSRIDKQSIDEFSRTAGRPLEMDDWSTRLKSSYNAIADAKSDAEFTTRLRQNLGYDTELANKSEFGPLDYSTSYIGDAPVVYYDPKGYLSQLNPKAVGPDVNYAGPAGINSAGRTAGSDFGGVEGPFANSDLQQITRFAQTANDPESVVLPALDEFGLPYSTAYGDTPITVIAQKATIVPKAAIAPRSVAATEDILGQGGLGTRIGAAANEIKQSATQNITKLINNPLDSTAAKAAEVSKVGAANQAGAEAINAENIADGAIVPEAGLGLGAGVGEEAAGVVGEDLAIAEAGSSFGPIGTAIAGVAILGASLWHLFDPDDSKPAIIPTPNYSNPVFQPGGR